MDANVKDDGPAQRDDELFDVVDGDDRVIGQATRREVHARKLWHRAVHALVFGRDGRVFLQKRSMAKDSAPGCWDSSCSGHLDAGEDYDKAVGRELAEEIGLVVGGGRGPERWIRIVAGPETGWEFVWVYRLSNDGPFRLHPAEIERGEWFTPEAVDRLIAEAPATVARAFRLIWGLARERMRAET